MIQIIRNKNELRKPNQTITDIDEGNELCAKLYSILVESKKTDYFALSAPQIGIKKRACVVCVDTPVFLINPRYIPAKSTDERILYREKSLSFDDVVFTQRHENIIVTSDAFANDIEYGPIETDRTKWTKNSYWNDMGIAKSVYIQHMIHLLNNEFYTDEKFLYIRPPIRNTQPKIGRNEYVTISNTTTNESKTIKYKFAKELIQNGWIIT